MNDTVEEEEEEEETRVSQNVKEYEKGGANDMMIVMRDEMMQVTRKI
jgi:hypothetical protein